MPVPIRYTKLELATRLRQLADHASEPERGRLLNLAANFGRDQELVSGSREAITESRKLLADLARLPK